MLLLLLSELAACLAPGRIAIRRLSISSFGMVCGIRVVQALAVLALRNRLGAISGAVELFYEVAYVVAERRGELAIGGVDLDVQFAPLIDNPNIHGRFRISRQLHGDLA